MDVPFSDIFDSLDGALTFHFEGLYKQRWGFFSDLNYIKLSPDDDGDIEIDYTQVQAELGFFIVSPTMPTPSMAWPVYAIRL